jgi:hypothetical protein
VHLVVRVIRSGATDDRGLRPRARAMCCHALDDETADWLLNRLGPELVGPIVEPVTMATSPPGVASTYMLLERAEA